MLILKTAAGTKAIGNHAWSIRRKLSCKVITTLGQTKMSESVSKLLSPTELFRLDVKHSKKVIRGREKGRQM